MANLHLLQRRRRDGSLLLRGQNPWDDPVFPDEFDFGFTQIGEGTYPAKIQGDTVVLEYANARATYKVTGPLRLANGTRGEDGFAKRPDLGHHGELVSDSVEFFDAPEVTDEGIAAYRASLPVEDHDESDVPGVAVAKPGTALVDDKPVEHSDNSGGKV